MSKTILLEAVHTMRDVETANAMWLTSATQSQGLAHLGQLLVGFAYY